MFKLDKSSKPDRILVFINRVKFTSCFYDRNETKLHRSVGDTVPLSLYLHDTIIAHDPYSEVWK